MGYHNHYKDTDFNRGEIRIDHEVKNTVAELRKKGEHVVVAAKKALKDGADIILRDMLKRVPVYKVAEGKKPPRHVIPGLLKSSLMAESAQDGAIYIFSANARNPVDNFLYGPILEFSKWRKIRGKKVKTKRRKFLYPALDAHIGEVNSMVRKAIDEAIARGN